MVLSICKRQVEAMKINIYIATQKKHDFPKNKNYIPLLVGKPFETLNSGFNDSVDESISAKNPFYCELTGHYWIWKNDHQSDIVGLCHYRRFLWINDIRQRLCRKNFVTLNEEIERYLDTCNIESIINDYDIILPRPYAFSKDDIKSQFIFYHGQENYKLMMSALQNLYPDYFDTAKLVFRRRYEYLANLLITKKIIFDAYSEWLFNVLQDVEDHLNLEDKNNARLLGYMGERLLNLYVFHNKLRIKEVPQIFLTGTNDYDEDDLYVDFRYIKRRYFAGILDIEEKIRKKLKSGQ